MREAVENKQLQKALLSGDLSSVRALLTAHIVNDDCQLVLQRKPLHLAASFGDVSVVTYLIELGATVDCEDCSGNTPLYLAALLGKLDAVKVLIQKGDADYNRIFLGQSISELLPKEYQQEYSSFLQSIIPQQQYTFMGLCRAVSNLFGNTAAAGEDDENAPAPDVPAHEKTL